MLVTQHFHDSGKAFGADTAEAARRLLRESGWTEEHYRQSVELMRRRAQVYEAEEGFFPPPAITAPVC